MSGHAPRWLAETGGRSPFRGGLRTSSTDWKGRFRPKLLLAARRITTAYPPFEEEDRPYPGRPARWRNLDQCRHRRRRRGRAGPSTPRRSGMLRREADPRRDRPRVRDAGRLVQRSRPGHGRRCADAAAAPSPSVGRGEGGPGEAGDAARTLAWPGDEAHPTVYAGRIDFRVQGQPGNGTWFAPPSNSTMRPGIGILNLQLSVLAAPGALGSGRSSRDGSSTWAQAPRNPSVSLTRTPCPGGQRPPLS